jgi:ABC-2 type transport system permease protein
VLANRRPSAVKVEIIDSTGKLGPALVPLFAASDWQAKVVPPGTTEDAELDRIKRADINGFLTIPADAFAFDGSNDSIGKISYQGDNASSTSVLIAISKTVAAAMITMRASDAGMSPTQLKAIMIPPNLSLVHTTGEKNGSNGRAVFAMGYVIMILLYISILLYGVAVMRSVVQEKTSRVIELMVATTKPRSLMAGKILGVGAVGLLQLSIWLLMALLTVKYREGLLGMFGVKGGGIDIPPLELDQIAVALGYFVGGYFFFAAIYAAVGAMVSSEQDTQQVQMPVTMVMVIGILCVQMVSNDPRGTAASIMTMVPFWSAMLMSMRYVLGGATLGEVMLSLGILVVSTVLIARAAAKIYRVGVLMYGKRPDLGELVRWLRY